MLGSLMHHVGFHWKTLPVNLPEKILTRFKLKPVIQTFWNGQTPLQLLKTSPLEASKKEKLIRKMMDLGTNIEYKD